jgi:hypothetical protein
MFAPSSTAIELPKTQNTYLASLPNGKGNLLRKSKEHCLALDGEMMIDCLLD